MGPDGPPSDQNGPVRELTDPRQLRALSHPLRMQILDVLARSDTPLTATQLGQRIGESSSSMSYHLRQLAKYGFVEEAPEAGSGRQRPWRKASRAMSFATSRRDTPGYDTAARELTHLVVDLYFQRITSWLAHEPELPEEWREAGGMADDRIFVTPDELKELRDRISDLLGPYERSRPDERPPEAHAVSLMLFLAPDVDEFDDLSDDA